jgi:SAM-dependent methyltransferase
MSSPNPSGNLHPATVKGFGQEWAAYDQTALGEDEHRILFDAYFSIFPFETLPTAAEGFDLGCGSGRWAAGIVDRVGSLHCIDPSAEALAVARRRLGAHPAARFHEAGVDAMPIADSSQDFGYSLGVLHHVPDTQAAIRDCVRKLKQGAPLLLYLYYSLDIRPGWFRAAWRASDLARRFLSRLPFPLRKGATSAIAALVYWPITRVALAAEKAGADVSNIPLSAYRHLSFYTMRTDALDRFGTRLEQRFSRAEIEKMMRSAGLADIRFREGTPYWVACGRRES